jgi:hypothetical protein
MKKENPFSSVSLLLPEDITEQIDSLTGLLIS